MRTITLTCTLHGQRVGPIPNEKPGPWDGSGDRVLRRVQEVGDDSDAHDGEWDCIDETVSRDVYETLVRRGYTDEFA